MRRKIYESLNGAGLSPAALAEVWREMRWAIRYIFLGEEDRQNAPSGISWESIFREPTPPSRFWVAVNLVVVLALGSTVALMVVSVVVAMVMAVIFLLWEGWWSW